VIRKHTRRAAKAAFAISFGVAIVLGVFAGTARPATQAAPTIVIGTKNFSEEYILGQLYKQALEAKGFKVSYKENIGSTEVIQTSLTSGAINFYPEYVGVIVQDVFDRRSPKTATGTYDLAKKLEAAKGYTLLDATPFSDTDVVVVTKAFAKKYALRSIADLRKAGTVAFGALPGCETRRTCLVGYRRAYGLKTRLVPLSDLSVYAALDAGTIQAGDGFSTDPPLGPDSKYTVLRDPKHVAGFQNVAPVVKTSVLKASGAGFAKTVNAVSAKLTLNAIVAMNTVVEVNKQDAAVVASAFLKANGLK
jgi:osmoprotectant transport system substrate-binding protein